MPTPLDAASWAATFSHMVPPLAEPGAASKPPRNHPRGRIARLHLDAAISRLHGCMNVAQGSRIAVEPADVQAVLDALERLRPAPRPPRLENLVALRSATNPRTKTEIPAAHCPDDNTNMRCLATRRPEPGMVRRRWECPRCKKRFTSYTHEKE